MQLLIVRATHRASNGQHKAPLQEILRLISTAVERVYHAFLLWQPPHVHDLKTFLVGLHQMQHQRLPRDMPQFQLLLKYANLAFHRIFHDMRAKIQTQLPQTIGFRQRLRQQIQATADPVLIALQAELLEYPAPEESSPLVLDGEMLGVVMPFCFQSARGTLSFISTTTIFGTPVDVTLQELAVESFFPADEFTAQVLREMAASA